MEFKIELFLICCYSIPSSPITKAEMSWITTIYTTEIRTEFIYE